MTELLGWRERRGLLRWLLCELSTDESDMISFFTSLALRDDEDAQTLHEALACARPERFKGPLRARYQDGKQLVAPREALRSLTLPRTVFYELVKRGAFPRPVQIDDTWVGWPKEILLGWSPLSKHEETSACPLPGYAPFERHPPVGR